MATLSKKDILEIVIGDDMDNDEFEDLLHYLLKNKISRREVPNEKLGFGARASDAIAKFVGSWRFIISFIVLIVLWVVVNIILAVRAFDAYPFILLNLFLSCVAAIQAPLIMMSQNRQEEKDRKRAIQDYEINLKSEIILKDLHEKIDRLIDNQEKIMNTQKGKESSQN